ncbi:MED6-domain-containing protein [Schizophyllum commune Loenen D]|nr:MED6-domain-containing protein [Schizophyllum commune Loenen D]
MDFNDLHPIDDMSHRYFVDPMFLEAWGGLSEDNLFMYFEHSGFYDRGCNNEILRMQTFATGEQINLLRTDKLKSLKGVEYMLVRSEPPSLFIIHKQERLFEEEVKPLQVYFIINGNVYQAPDVHTVLSNRLLTTLHSLQNTMDILRKHRPDYTPRTGFVWPVTNPVLEEDKLKRATAANTRLATQAPGTPMEGEAPPLAGQPAGKTDPLHGSTRKVQNTQLLFHSMFTASRHLEKSRAPPPQPAPTPAPQPTPVVGAQASAQGSGSGAATNAAPTPAPSRPPEPPAKGQPGAGKKKKKRVCGLYIGYRTQKANVS